MDAAAVRSAQVRADLLLLLTALIWGFAFVAQRAGMEHVGPFFFNGVRFALGCLPLLPFVLRTTTTPLASRLRHALPGGLLAGLFLFTAASLQQVGIVYTTAGKAGFITGLYVILVPILGLLLRHRSRRSTWTGALVATSGLYLLSVEPPLAIAHGDALVLVSAFFWAGHVLVIGRLSRQLDWAMLAFLQFFVCSLLSTAVAVSTEHYRPATARRCGHTRVLRRRAVGGRGLYPPSSGSAASGPRPRGHHPQSGDGFRRVGRMAFAKTRKCLLRGLVGCGLMFAGMLISQDIGARLRIFWKTA